MAKHKKKLKMEDAPPLTPMPGDVIRYTPAIQEGILVKIWPDGTHACITEDGGWFEAWNDLDDEIEVIEGGTMGTKLMALRELVSHMRIRHDNLPAGTVHVDEELLQSLEAVVGRG